MSLQDKAFPNSIKPHQLLESTEWPLSIFSVIVFPRLTMNRS